MDEDFSEFSDEEVIQMSTELRSLTSSTDKMFYVIEKTGFKYLGKETFREISGKDYYWGIAYWSDEKSKIAGNLYITFNKSEYISAQSQEISLRIERCNDLFEIKRLIEAEINRIKGWLNKDSLTSFK